MLDARPSSVAVARRFCTRVLIEWGAADLADVVSLLVGELVTNVVLHAGTACELRLERTARLRVEVIDGSRRLPTRRLIDSEAGSGRGLLLVEALSAEYGTTVEAHGKRVWFEMDWP
jgi:anti-sigma regulatory factor (Ser/Thr protein kinase)